MKIKQVEEKLKAAEEKSCHPKDENDVKSGTSEFYDLKRELEEKGFPLRGIEKAAYSARYGKKTIDYLNRMSTTVWGGMYCFCGSCIA